MLSNEDKKEIKRIVASEMDSYNGKDSKKDLIKTLKNDSEVRKYIVDIIRNSLDDLYRFMYTKRTTWQREIGNKK